MQKKNRKTAPPGFLTAQEAIATIGVPSTTFYNLVKEGVITGVMLPGRKEKIYPLQNVEAYRRSLREAMSPYQHTQDYHFGIALKEDIPEIRELVASENGGYEHTVPQEIMEAWIRKNPQALHILTKGTQLVGYVSMFPLPLEAIMKRLSGAYWNRTIPIDDIQPFAPRTPYPLYIAEIAARKDAEGSDPRQIEKHLISEIAKLLMQWAKEGIVFNEIYTVATGEEKINLWRSMGMQAMDLPEGTRKDRIPFKLDVQHAGASLLTGVHQQADEQDRQR